VSTTAVIMLSDPNDTSLFQPLERGLLNADAQTTDSFAAWVLAAGAGFNGAAMDRLRTGSAANLALLSALGALLTTRPGEWSVSSAPAANIQATASRAAVAGVRHVCTSLTARLMAGPTIASAGAITLNLRDGATGAGTILWSQKMAVGGAGSITEDRDVVQLTGLNIVGSVNTAMTFEFATAGGASTLECVAMTGYDAA